MHSQSLSLPSQLASAQNTPLAPPGRNTWAGPESENHWRVQRGSCPATWQALKSPLCSSAREADRRQQEGTDPNGEESHCPPSTPPQRLARGREKRLVTSQKCHRYRSLPIPKIGTQKTTLNHAINSHLPTPSPHSFHIPAS